MIIGIPKEIKNRPESYWDDTIFGSPDGTLGKIRSAKNEAKDNYFRQENKGFTLFGVQTHDKDGHLIKPFSSKKEMKPAAIVAPVKRPSEAVMKKLTGK